MHGGQAYGARAVLSAAHQKATGTAVPEHDWASKDQAARILRELGFRVLAGDDPEAVVPGQRRLARDQRGRRRRDPRGLGGSGPRVPAGGRPPLPGHGDLQGPRHRGPAPQRHPDQAAHAPLDRRGTRPDRSGQRRARRAAAVLAVRDGRRAGRATGTPSPCRRRTATRRSNPQRPRGQGAAGVLPLLRRGRPAGRRRLGGAAEAGHRPADRGQARVDATSARGEAADQAGRPPRDICPTCFMAIPRSGVCDNCGSPRRSR